MLKALFSRKKDQASKQVYLHIGMPKTGTTSIQNNLYANRRVLEAHGIHYLSSGLDKTGHHVYGASIESETFKSEVHGPIVFDTIKRQKYRDDLVKEIAKSHASRFIVSSEVLWKVQNLKGLLEPFTPWKPKVVVYIRRQDRALISTYSMLVKWGAGKEEFLDYLAKNRGEFLYSKKLDNLAALFGKDNLIVRPFDEKRLKNSSLIEDFFDAIGSLDVLPQLSISDERDNEALSLLQLEFKQRLNKEGLDWNKGRDILTRLEKIDLGDKDSSIKSLLNYEQRLELMSFFNEDNDYILKNYFPTYPYQTLFSGVTAESAQLPKHRLDLKTAFYIFSRLLEN